MKNPKTFLYLVVFALVAGCAAEEHPDAGAVEAVLAGAPSGPVVATVGGEEITTQVLEAFARGRKLDPANPEQRAQALEQLIETVVVAQDARAAGLAQQPEVRSELALARALLLSGRRLEALREGIQISDAELQEYYQQEVARAGNVELHLQHLLFASEEAALEAAGRALQPGADFEALIAEYGNGSGQQARDLGWANLAQLPAEIGAAAQQLADGQVSPVPIQSRFGWHVLRRVESRPFQPPPFEQVREGARRHLVDRAVAEKLEALREQADVVLPGQAQD